MAHPYFTSGADKAYSTGGPAMIELAANQFGLYAGDGIPDGLVQALDAVFYLFQTVSVGAGFNQADYNLDGAVEDIWSSDDGTSWTFETGFRPWPHVTTVHGGCLWLIGSRHVPAFPGSRRLPGA